MKKLYEIMIAIARQYAKGKDYIMGKDEFVGALEMYIAVTKSKCTWWDIYRAGKDAGVWNFKKDVIFIRPNYDFSKPEKAEEKAV